MFIVFNSIYVLINKLKILISQFFYHALFCSCLVASKIPLILQFSILNCLVMFLIKSDWESESNMSHINTAILKDLMVRTPLRFTTIFQL